jgi:tripeptide aminopeptidase
MPAELMQTPNAVNEQRALDTFLELVQIDSPSGQEAEVADYLLRALGGLGIVAERDRTGNVIARRAGRGHGAGQPPLLLCAHMDTVQQPGTSVRPRIDDGVIRSDGTTILGADDKAGITAVLEALRVVAEQRLASLPLELAFTVQEETGLTGSKQLDMAGLRARRALVLDSNGPVGTIVNRAPAQNSFDVAVHGRAAHAGVSPELGVSAIQAAARALAGMRLGRIDAETTANVGVISGGAATNIVPERVELKGEARSRDEAKLQAQTDHMVELFRSAAAQDGARADVSVRRVYGAIDVPAESPLVATIAAAMRRCGLTPELVPTGGGSDANILNAAGVEAVNLGIGYTNPHSVDECLAVADLVLACRVMLEVVTSAA